MPIEAHWFPWLQGAVPNDASKRNRPRTRPRNQKYLEEVISYSESVTAHAPGLAHFSRVKRSDLLTMIRPHPCWAGKNVPVPLLQGVNGYSEGLIANAIYPGQEIPRRPTSKRWRHPDLSSDHQTGWTTSTGRKRKVNSTHYETAPNAVRRMARIPGVTKWPKL